MTNFGPKTRIFWKFNDVLLNFERLNGVKSIFQQKIRHLQ